MARLIDADDLYDLIDGGFDIDFDETPETKRELLRMVKEAPTIDAEPVRYGHWKRSKYYPHIIICDECGEPYELSNSMEHWNYCPNCGYKMDLEEVKNEIN